MQRVDRRRIELQERLATGADHERATAGRAPLVHGWPARAHGVRQRFRVCEAAAVGTHADEIGVTELTDGAMTIGFAPRPQVAAREPAEDGGTSGVLPFTLQRVENFPHDVRHDYLRAYGAGSGTPASANPFRRSAHASQ